MTSVIYFRFRNALKQESVSFDGAVIQVGDVKRLIASALGVLADASEELLLFDPSSNAEYKDDSKLLPRNSLVLVKRQPVAAARPVDRTGQGGSGGPRAPGALAAGGYSLNPSLATVTPASGEGGEDAALADLVRGAAAAWKKEVAVGYSRFRAQNRARTGAQDQPRPDYRCPVCDAVGQHWASDCPKAGEGGAERPPPGRRALAPVGIPASRLAAAADGSLVLPNGSVGTLLANEAAFARDVAGLPTAAASRRDQPSRLALQGRGGDARDDEAPLGLPGVPGWAPPGVAGGGMGGDEDAPLALPGAAALLPPRPPSSAGKAAAAADEDEPALALPHLAAFASARGRAAAATKGADRASGAGQASTSAAAPHVDDDSELSEDEAFPPPPNIRVPTLKRRKPRRRDLEERGMGGTGGMGAGAGAMGAVGPGSLVPWSGAGGAETVASGPGAASAAARSGGPGAAVGVPNGLSFAQNVPSGVSASLFGSFGASPGVSAPPYLAPGVPGPLSAPSPGTQPSGSFAAALAAGALPPGPPAMLAAAFDRDEPLSQSAFEALQAEHRALLGLPRANAGRRQHPARPDRSPGESVGQSRGRRDAVRRPLRSNA